MSRSKNKTRLVASPLPPVKRPIKRSAVTLVAANMVPLFGVVFWGWDIFPLVFLYWTENAATWLMTVFKIALARPSGQTARMGRASATLVFFLSYGLFTVIHGCAVIVLFNFSALQDPAGPSFWAVAGEAVGEPGLLWAILALLVSHVMNFRANFLPDRDRPRDGLMEFMGAPFGRIVLLHVFIIVGGVAIQNAAASIPVLAGFVVAKTAIDLWAHLREHRPKKDKQGPSRERRPHKKRRRS